MPEVAASYRHCCPAAQCQEVADQAFDDLYDVDMIRKQLYISDDHERALKARAEKAGISEAELIRRFLDRLLLGSESSVQIPLGRGQAASEFLESTDEIATSHRFAEGYRFNRGGIYENRGLYGPDWAS